MTETRIETDGSHPLPGGGWSVGDDVRYGGAPGLKNRDLPRRVGRVRVRVESLPSPRCPLQFQAPNGWLLGPGVTSEIEVYADQLASLEDMVSDAQDDERFRAADEHYMVALIDEDFRAALTETVTDDIERDQVGRATVPELRAMLANAPADSAVARAYKLALGRTTHSVSRSWHTMYSRHGHAWKTLKSVEVLETLPPPDGRFGAAPANGNGSSDALTILSTFMQQQASRDAETQKLIAQLLASVDTTSKKDSK